MNSSETQTTPVSARLGLWDAVSIIIGIVIGATIYETPWLIFGNVRTPWEGMGAWALGGMLSLVGAFCYAELATTYPRSGGDYVYLTRAYGSGMGFLFGWAQLAALQTGGIGMMAYIFSNYATGLWNLGPLSGVGYAVLAVLVLSVVNALGVVLGKGMQNVLTGTKVLGLGGILLAGLLVARPDAPPTEATQASSAQADAGTTSSSAADADAEEEASGSSSGVAHYSFGLAMIFVLLAYGGWSDAAFVAAEVRDRQRNLPLALVLGTGGVMLIYLLVNAAYLSGLGFEGVKESRTPAADILDRWMGGWGAGGMSLLVMISALGAVNGLILTGSRVYASMGADHRLFAGLSRWHPRRGVPVWSIAVQALICIVMIAVAGTETGLRAVNAFLTTLWLEPVPELGSSGFEVLLKATAPVFWFFFLLTGISLIVLRMKNPHLERPFSVPLYPVLPLIFCGMCVYMLYSALDYAQTLTLLGVVPVLLGLPLYFVSRLWSRRD